MELDVAWMPPSDSGNSLIFQYVVTAVMNGTGSKSTNYILRNVSMDVLSLTLPIWRSVSYFVSVQARNRFGLGTAGSISVTYHGSPAHTTSTSTSSLISAADTVDTVVTGAMDTSQLSHIQLIGVVFTVAAFLLLCIFMAGMFVYLKRRLDEGGPSASTGCETSTENP